MRTRGLLGLVVWTLLLADSVSAQWRTTLSITVTAGKHGYKNVPVVVPVSLPKAFEESSSWIVTLESGALRISGQLTRPGILTDHIKATGAGPARWDIHFVLPRLKAGTSATFRCTVARGNSLGQAGSFYWKAKEERADLYFSRPAPHPVLRYMKAPYDNSNKEKRDKTYKVFHHLFDPSGKRLVTNGGETDENITDPKKLLYPHHRGLMYAFNRITYDGGKHADTWHAKPGDTHQAHDSVVEVEGGDVLGRERVLIDWYGSQNDVFAKEERELTAYNVPGGTLVQFASRLKTADGKVILDGDPQHAGFQFRAANAVAEKTEQQTYFLRPDGKGQPNQTRNWPESKGHVNLPWDAMCFVLDGRRYTVAYLNNPKNPGEQRYSERAYGRIGCYFKYELTKDRPLVVRYRVWLQQGEMTVPQVQALSTAFVDPPRVAVK